MRNVGANLDIPNEQRVECAGAVRAEIEASELPRCLWAYSNTFALYDNDDEVGDEDMLTALTGSYLRPASAPIL